MYAERFLTVVLLFLCVGTQLGICNDIPFSSNKEVLSVMAETQTNRLIMFFDSLDQSSLRAMEELRLAGFPVKNCNFYAVDIRDDSIGWLPVLLDVYTVPTVRFLRKGPTPHITAHDLVYSELPVLLKDKSFCS